MCPWWFFRRWLLSWPVCPDLESLLYLYSNKDVHVIYSAQSILSFELIIWTISNVVALQRTHIKKILCRLALQELGSLCCLLPFRVLNPHLGSHLHRLYHFIQIDSWNSYQYSLVQPNLSFQNYQATCLLSSGVVTYDSSFTNEPTTNSYQTFISAGGDGSDLIINAVVQSANISACNLLLYFQVTLSVIIKPFRTDFPQLLSCLFSFTEIQLIMHSGSLQSKNGGSYKRIFSQQFHKVR